RRNEQFLFPNASISYNKRAFLLNTSYAGERTQFNIRENQEVYDRVADSYVRSEQSLLQSGNSHRFTGTLRYQASESAAVEVYGWFSAYGQAHNGDARIQNNAGDWHFSPREESDRNQAGLLSTSFRYSTENHVVSTEYSHSEMHATSKIDFPGLDLASSISPSVRTRMAKLDVESTLESMVRLQYGLSGNHLERSFSEENSEMIWAGYVAASHRHDRNEFQGGIRTEYHSVFGWYFLPSMVWHHRLSDQRASVRAAYRSSVVQPHIYQRLGEQMWDDPLNFAGGNPDLKASLHRTVQLDLSGNMGSTMMSLQYKFRYEGESLQRRISAAPHEGIQTNWYNAKYAWNHGLRLSGMMAFSPKLGLQFWAEPGQAGFEDGNSWYFAGGGSAYWQVVEPLTIAFMLNHEGSRIGSERTHYSGTLYFINATVRPREGVSFAAVSGIPFARSFVYDGFRATTSEMDVRSEGQILMSSVPIWFTLTIDVNRGSNSIARRASARDNPEVVRRNKKGF
ncbi:MAG: outer membrane beta-barrel protein, partial [Balneolales bacterium]|nr:outer membrane beta-barrel protein [Balneolales bacterium]